MIDDWQSCYSSSYTHLQRVARVTVALLKCANVQEGKEYFKLLCQLEIEENIAHCQLAHSMGVSCDSIHCPHPPPASLVGKVKANLLIPPIGLSFTEVLLSQLQFVLLHLSKQLCQASEKCNCFPSKNAHGKFTCTFCSSRKRASEKITTETTTEGVTISPTISEYIEQWNNR